MGVSPSGSRFKHSERPAPCWRCGAYAVWNGVRRVGEAARDAIADGVRVIAGVVRRRVRCSDRGCPAGSWTIYAAGSYPHRVFQLPVVVSAVSDLARGAGSTMTAIANRHDCSRRSVSRWLGWVAALARPAHLARVCARLDPQGLSGAALVRDGAGALGRAGSVLGLLDRLAGLLADRGVRLPGGRECHGLVGLLAWQLERFGDRWLLTRSSPPLRVDLRALRM